MHGRTCYCIKHGCTASFEAPWASEDAKSAGRHASAERQRYHCGRCASMVSEKTEHDRGHDEAHIAT